MAVNIIPAFEWVTNKRTVSVARCIVKKYDEVRFFIRSRSSQLWVAETQSQFDEYYVRVNKAAVNGGKDNNGKLGSISHKFQSQLATIAASQTCISGKVRSTL